MKHVIYWFRHDLRLHDQFVLSQLHQQADTLLPVFCLDPAWLCRVQPGFAKTGAWRLRFLIESLRDLQQSLLALGSDLVVVWGTAAGILPDLVEQYQIQAVFCQSEICFEEQAEEVAVAKALGDVPLHKHEAGSLIQLNDLPFELDDLPDVFTQFRKRVEADLKVPDLQPKFTVLPPLPDHLRLPGWPDWKSMGLAEVHDDSRAPMRFVGGEQTALQRVDEYLWQGQWIRTYKDTRNGLLGDTYSSRFSPWLANGSLSVRYVYHQIKTYETQIIANESAYWLIFELLWRDYFRLVARKYGRRIFLNQGLKDVSPVAFSDTDLFQTWCQGKTGNEFIDANMIELKQTGWMSNRGRQNVASYLIHDLQLPWKWGAAWFEHHLIDYDPCSNWCNWMYIAGVGNDPRPQRRFNVEKQAKEYDPERKFRDLWLGEGSKF